MPDSADASASAMTPTNPKLMVVPPRINLRRTASYNHADKGPLSATSSGFSFNRILFSPPPSPSLPALLPRRKKSTSAAILTTRPSRVARLLLICSGVFVLLYLVSQLLQVEEETKAAIWPYYHPPEEYELIEQTDFPRIPTPLLLRDAKDDPHWAVSIPYDYDFPLSMDEYTTMAKSCREVSARAHRVDGKQPLTAEAMLQHDKPDPYYVDVDEAEKIGLMPQTKERVIGSPADVVRYIGQDSRVIWKPVCDRTMVFVLEGTDAGLGNTLMMLWTFYGLAKAQQRSFFVDDSRWAYGRYTGLFAAPPLPACEPPPRHHIVPCPFQARHLVVSSVTANEVFPALVAMHHRSAGTRDKTRDLYALARTGFEELGKLNDEDAKYVVARMDWLRLKSGTTITDRAPVIGMHVRHGDRHPFEFQYHHAYIPHEVFNQTAEKLVKEFYNERLAASGITTAAEETQRNSVLLLASDDPLMYRDPLFAHAYPAQEQIRLQAKIPATHGSDEKQADPSVLRQFRDPDFGWEGGFFASMFWGMGRGHRDNAANAPLSVAKPELQREMTAPPSEETMKLRSIIARAYLMDLTVLAKASDHVICTVSAMGCRLLGVMMGWDKAMKQGGWVNVDGDYGWTGIEW